MTTSSQTILSLPVEGSMVSTSMSVLIQKTKIKITKVRIDSPTKTASRNGSKIMKSNGYVRVGAKIAHRAALFAVQSYTLRSADEAIEDTADEMEKEHEDEPDDFVITLGRLFGENLNQRPDPKDKEQEENGKGEKEKENRHGGVGFGLEKWAKVE